MTTKKSKKDVVGNFLGWNGFMALFLYLGYVEDISAGKVMAMLQIWFSIFMVFIYVVGTLTNISKTPEDKRKPLLTIDKPKVPAILKYVVVFGITGFLVYNNLLVTAIFYCLSQVSTVVFVKFLKEDYNPKYQEKENFDL